MGSPVSVVVANLFMDDLEEKALQSFPHGVKVWKRYVDDTFVLVKQQQVDAVHDHLNRQASGVSFTVEKERDGVLPFLDIEVKRADNGSVGTAVFRKVTHTDKYLDFNSHHSRQHKESVVRSLVKRGDTFPSDEQERQRETKHIEGALRANNYPKHFIQKTRRIIQVRETGREAEGRNRDDQDGQRKPFVV